MIYVVANFHKGKGIVIFILESINLQVLLQKFKDTFVLNES